MKTILLPVHADDGSEARLQAALDIARAGGAHLDCLQVTPFNAYVAADVFGGVFVLPDVIDAVNKQVEALRTGTEDRLGREDVSWSYRHLDGDPARTIVDQSLLADLIILSPALREARPDDPLPIAGDVAIHARPPVLVLPGTATGFDVSAPAMVAWNGSPEAANALKAALPLLRLASTVTVVAVEESDAESLPPIEACEYLSRHGVKAEFREVSPGQRGVAEALLAERERCGAGYIVMGAYGHSRFREIILGGVTRHMLRHCRVPLLLSH